MSTNGLNDHRPYPAYRDSGVDWLGTIPNHWDVLPLKRLMEVPITDGPHETPEILDEGIPFISAEAIKDNQIDFEKKRGFISVDDYRRYSKKYHPQRGDIYMVKSGATTGNVAIVETDMEFNIWSPLAAMRPNINIVSTKFLFYNLSSKGFFYAVETGWSYGTQQNIGMGVLENISCSVPPLPEQQAIGRFLDHKTSEIDALIAAKERLITLLQEKRAALITHAVTKGLDPSVPMKDSGIEWLGRIPAHWSVKKYKYVTSRVVVGIAQAATHAYADEGVPIVRSTNIRPNHLEIDDLKYLDPEFALSSELRSKLVSAGDIVTVRTGNAGVSAIVPNELDQSQSFTLLISTLRPDQNNEFCCYFLNSLGGQAYFNITGWGTAQKNISVPILQDIPVPEPPPDERESIVKHISDSNNEIDRLIEEIGSGISLLSEYRTALISSTVTGKIDVRNTALE